jgi:thermostable 8-oxoguanine DNA glycosylase
MAEIHFDLRFPKDQLREWASRYPHGDADARMAGIGTRSRQAGFYTREDVFEIYAWRRMRRRQTAYMLRNSEEQVRKQTCVAFAATSEESRMASLLLLDGVSWQTASRLLHFAFEDQYPVLDLHGLRSLGRDSIPYSFSFWWNYAGFCRALASECDVSLRELDRALWTYAGTFSPR